MFGCCSGCILVCLGRKCKLIGSLISLLNYGKREMTCLKIEDVGYNFYLIKHDFTISKFLKY